MVSCRGLKARWRIIALDMIASDGNGEVVVVINLVATVSSTGEDDMRCWLAFVKRPCAATKRFAGFFIKT